LSALGIALGDTVGIIDACKGLSLNDSYWIVPQGFDGKFADYNLYENHMRDVLSLVALTGEMSGGESAESLRLELTTNGNVPKAWMYTDADGMCLYKGAYYGREPYSEYYAYQVAEAMGLDAVAYGLEEQKGVLVSKCRLFTSVDVSYVPVGRLVGGRSIDKVLSFYESMGEDALESVKSMLAFDCVVTNIDRHFGNFGFLRDAHTGELLRPAPIYDNGLSLYAHIENLDTGRLADYERVMTPYEVTFPTLAKAVIGDRQKQQLKNLKEFTFKPHEKYELPGDYLERVAERVREKAGQWGRGTLSR
jgi:hypothetical protein